MTETAEHLPPDHNPGPNPEPRQHPPEHRDRVLAAFDEALKEVPKLRGDYR
jgi:hypothetical protein